MTSRRRRKTADALTIIDRMIGPDGELRVMIDEEVANAQLAALIRTARSDTGMTQAQLAAAIGSTQPSIARLEDGDYDGHSLSMLRRIATALGRRVELRFVANSSKRRPPA